MSKLTDQLLEKHGKTTKEVTHEYCMIKKEELSVEEFKERFYQEGDDTKGFKYYEILLLIKLIRKS